MVLEAAPRDADIECRLLSDSFGYLVQVLLGVLALAVLVYKRKIERPQRKLSVFVRDSSKQAFGAGVAHLINIGLSMLLATVGNECNWYAVTFIMDTVLGTVMNIVLLHAFEALLVRVSPRFESGVYSDDSPNFDFVLQLALWTAVVSLVKLVIFYAILYPFAYEVYAAGSFVLQPLFEFPKLQLFVVMIIIPAILNVVAFWVQDNYLMRAAENLFEAVDSESEGDSDDEFARSESLWKRGRRYDPDNVGQ